MSVGGWKWPKRLIATFELKWLAMTNNLSPLNRNSPARGFRLVLKAAFVGSSLPGLAESSGTPPLSTTVVAVVDPSRTIDEAEPAIGAEEEADADVATGFAVLAIDGIDLAKLVRGPPAAWMAAISVL